MNGMGDLVIIPGKDMPPEWHKGGDQKKRNAKSRSVKRQKSERESRIIAWDGEGIKLRGNGRPQHYVLYGCSAEPDTPLSINTHDGDLAFRELADYMCDVSDRYPGAKHIGYFFGYDQNMIIKHLPWRLKHILYEKGRVRYKVGDVIYSVAIKFGKQIFLTRIMPDGKKSRIRIDDMGPFFASAFVKAYQRMFSDFATDPDWQIVVNGKLNRSTTVYEDMGEIRTYWEIEIAALERLATFFRDLMFKAGFPLTEWYGPGALAKKIRQMYRLGEHEWGGKERNLPGQVHLASKMAYFGGHFEQYQVGRIHGPVYGYDIRSAYPFAFTTVPTMREGGFWQEVETPSESPETFGVYHVRYCKRDALTPRGNVARGISKAMPLPHRNKNGEVIYSPVVEGWYWRPEIQVLMDLYPEDEFEIYSGWEWRPATDEKPWADVLLPMFAKRRELKAIDDPSEMAFKLGPNSLYGKMAQRAGWNKENGTPPTSHTLCIAGFITSFCRAHIMRVISQIPEHQLIAVETDGIYTTASPDSLILPNGIGNELGQWDIETFDEMLYVQNGLYLARIGDRWSKIKTRGISARHIQPDSMSEYLSQCGAQNSWEPLQVSAGERFTGLGAAISRSVNDKGMVNPMKASILHCRWTPDERQIVPGGKGKRIHARYRCNACKQGLSANDGAHTLIINTPVSINIQEQGATPNVFDIKSFPYMLPWEKDYEAPEWIRKDVEADAMYNVEDYGDVDALA